MVRWQPHSQALQPADIDRAANNRRRPPQPSRDQRRFDRAIRGPQAKTHLPRVDRAGLGENGLVRCPVMAKQHLPHGLVRATETFREAQRCLVE